MQRVVIDKPYRFVPPDHGRFWPWVFGKLARGYLNRSFGVARVECRGVAGLRRSIEAGHGVLLPANHCRICDPFVVGLLAQEAGRTPFMMASWHLFNQGWFQSWVLRRGGAFSIYREGMDRAAVSAAIEILQKAWRPLIIFPEGAVSRTNDHINPLMEGVSLIAHTAAKKRAKASPSGKVVFHPVAIRYQFQGDLQAACDKVLAKLEQRLSWQPQVNLPLLNRVFRVGQALLGLKEIEYLGQSQGGSVASRIQRLVDHVLGPLEEEWLGERNGSDHVTARVKRLRSAILPDLVQGEISESERDRRWRQLTAIYLAQQLAFYPPDYIRSSPTPERILEMVEKFEEDLTDAIEPSRPWSVVVEAGEAIEVGQAHDRAGDADPMMQEIQRQITRLLAGLPGSPPIAAEVVPPTPLSVEPAA